MVPSVSQNPSVHGNMAAPGKHVGRYVQRNSKFLLNNLDRLWWSHRYERLAKGFFLISCVIKLFLSSIGVRNCLTACSSRASLDRRRSKLSDSASLSVSCVSNNNLRQFSDIINICRFKGAVRITNDINVSVMIVVSFHSLLYVTRL